MLDCSVVYMLSLLSYCKLLSSDRHTVYLCLKDPRISALAHYSKARIGEDSAVCWLEAQY